MNLKTRIAIFTAKATKSFMRLLKKQASLYPGFVGQKIDKDILKNIEKPRKIYGVTGTNGKTTSANLIADILDILNVSYSSNRIGSNVKGGIITSLIDSNKLFGGRNKDAAVLEIDELWSREIIKDIDLTSLTITNLFQDSYERNANIFYVKKRLEQSIKPGAKLILNASDPISSNLELDNEKIYYDVKNIFHEDERRSSKINDMIYCPKCGSKIEWAFNRYHHLGNFKCPNCGFTNKKADYLVESFDPANNTILVNDKGNLVELPLIQKVIESVYNQVAVYATLREDGFTHEDIAAAMSKIKIVESRYLSERVGKKEIISLVQKGYNPVSISRLFDNISKHEAENKTIISLSQNLESKYLDHRSPGWAWSIDFQYIKDKIDKIIVLSRHYPELYLAMLMAGLDEEKIILVDSEEEILNHIDFSKDETIFITHDIEKENINQGKLVADLIKKKASK
ncbi:MAG: MurT ligase domain-containing protein [Tissierellia bacterium]|nr:MurT ligase domain-containing protein [Tissierellia bacterium]